MKNLSWILAATLALAVAGCKKDEPKPEPPIVPIDLKTGRLIEHGGVKYYVPQEPGSHSDAPGEFQFECESLRLIVYTNRIYVNGQIYGSVKPGDAVSFLNKGHVFINGVRRLPDK